MEGQSREPQPGDKFITCNGCGVDFLFEAGEAKWYEEKGFKEPKHCKPCRQARRTGRQQVVDER